MLCSFESFLEITLLYCSFTPKDLYQFIFNVINTDGDGGISQVCWLPTTLNRGLEHAPGASRGVFFSLYTGRTNCRTC